LFGNLLWAPLSQVNLSGANLSGANLSGRNLSGAYLSGANFSGVDFSNVRLSGRNLSAIKKLSKTNLSGKNLSEADLSEADLSEADLSKANLSGANLSKANFSKANLSQADLQYCILVRANFQRSTLTNCRIYGISAWSLNLEDAKQKDLIITPENEPIITADNLEVAQFIYLLINNEKIRQVIDTITSKVVLILGRFAPKRKVVLDAIREALRQHGYLPVLFDFEIPGSRDITETVSTLAHMSRFVVADLTDPSSIPKELENIIPTLAVPVQPLLEGRERPYSMFSDYWKYHWVLEPQRYNSLDELRTSLKTRVIAPAEAKVNALQKARETAEAKARELSQ